MSQRKVVITVDVDGSTNIDAQGFTGNSCSLATKELEQLLTAGDAGSIDTKKKPDFYNTLKGPQTQRN